MKSQTHCPICQLEVEQQCSHVAARLMRLTSQNQSLQKEVARLRRDIGELNQKQQTVLDKTIAESLTKGN